MSVRVAVLDDFQGVAERFGPWEELGDRIELTVFRDHLEDEAELIERLSPFDVVVAMRERTPFGRGRLERLPRLRLLVTTAVANASFDLEAAADLGITVCGTEWTPTTTVELTWGLILALTHRICEEDRALRAGRWQSTVGLDLDGRCLALLGLGRIGGRMAVLGHAFGMEVIAWSSNLDRDRAECLGVEPVSREELFERADVLSIHLKLRERTRGLVGAADLARMKETAFLVNTSRGPIVEERALLDALEGGRIAGAGLDVFWEEPLDPSHPILRAPSTVLTPHIGFVSDRSYGTYFGGVVEDVAAFLDGEPIRTLTPERPSLDMPPGAAYGDDPAVPR